ncbi:MAG: ABC transporter ATP-binding protein [Firmicutes bacterium]|nr:ABC transporter ATP-binding protein [Bacillota bacterium]
MEKNYSVRVENVTKVYNLYNKPTDRLKEALSITKKSYHKKYYALKGVSFDIEKGETVGIIGLNGAGKSTILKIITGILSPTEGSVSVEGKISALLELGAGFNPEYTGRENIYLNAAMNGYTKAQTTEMLPEILDFADIGDFIDQPVKTYSSGMFVRLAFAVSINIKPEILIVDEALSVGDVFFQQKCYKKIKELSGSATVIIVSHDLNALTKFSKRIILMNKGEKVFDGDPNEAIARYFRIKQGGSVKRQTGEAENAPDLSNYKKPEEGQYSGNMNAVIEGYHYSVEGEPFSEAVKKDELIKVSMAVRVNKTIDYPIIGYQIRNKYADEIFGQTSLTSGVEQYPLKEGLNIIEFEFEWPEIREGDYFITLGVGNGTDVLNQVEECWINNAIHLCASTGGKTIFGIFNHDMRSFTVTEGEK